MLSSRKARMLGECFESVQGFHGQVDLSFAFCINTHTHQKLEGTQSDLGPR